VAPEPRALHVRPLGFGLLEVLAALAIAGVGLLGYALLLQHCLATQAAALRRAQATVLLVALTERIRMNPAARSAYALPLGAPVPAAPSCDAGSHCTPAQLAASDVSQWLSQRAATLPAAPAGVGASVDADSSASGIDRIVVTLQWAEPQMSAPYAMALTLLLPDSAA
jgi:type IV pilus modification protein PilV